MKFKILTLLSLLAFNQLSLAEEWGSGVKVEFCERAKLSIRAESTETKGYIIISHLTENQISDAAAQAKSKVHDLFAQYPDLKIEVRDQDLYPMASDDEHTKKGKNKRTVSRYQIFVPFEVTGNTSTISINEIEQILRSAFDNVEIESKAQVTAEQKTKAAYQLQGLAYQQAEKSLAEIVKNMGKSSGKIVQISPSNCSPENPGDYYYSWEDYDEPRDDDNAVKLTKGFWVVAKVK